MSSLAEYEARLDAAAEWLDALAFEHALRKRDPATARARWRIEAAAYRSAAPGARIVLRVAPGGEVDAWLRTLASWHLQTWPATAWEVQGAPDAGEPHAHARRAAGLPEPGDRSLHAGASGDWCVDAVAGDILHPSLAGEIATAAAAGAEAVAWDFLRFDAGKPHGPLLARHRAAAVDPLLDLVEDQRGRAFSLPRAAMPAAGGAAAAWRARLDAAARRWTSVHEPLSMHADPGPVDGATLPDRDAIATRLWGVPMTWLALDGGPLPVPAAPAASVSVVILFRDRAELTLAAIASVAQQAFEGRLELVLVDNQSTDATRSLLREQVARLPARIAVRWVGYPEPFNHSRQCMLGAAAAAGEVLLFLNNDARLLDPCALDAMARWARLPGIASVGACVVDADGRPVGGGFRARRLPGAEFNSPVEEATGRIATLPRCTVGNSFACAAVSAAAFKAVGGLDPVRYPVGFNDVDYCLRAARDGWRHLSLGPVRIAHFVGASRPKVDEIAQKLALRVAHPWLSARALAEPEREPAPPTPGLYCAPPVSPRFACETEPPT